MLELASAEFSIRCPDMVHSGLAAPESTPTDRRLECLLNGKG
jgi:hypothetical protein